MPIKPSDIWPDPKDTRIAAEEVERYVYGQMTSKEQHRFEMNMEADPILAGLVEKLLTDKIGAKTEVAEINKLIDQRYKSQGKVVSIFSFQNLSIAASLLLLIAGGIVFFISNEGKKIAKTPVAIQTPTTDTISQIEEPKVDNALSSSTPPKQGIVQMKENTPAHEESEDLALAKEDMQPQPIAPQAEEAMAMDRSSQLDEHNLTSEKDSVNDGAIAAEMLAYAPVQAYSKETKEEYKSSASNKKQKAAEMAPIAKPSAAGAAAPAKIQPSEKGDVPSISSTWQEIIVSKANTGQLAEAIEDLQNIINNDNTRTEQALWIQAALYLQANNRSGAIIPLRRLADANTGYTARAKSILKKIEK